MFSESFSHLLQYLNVFVVEPGLFHFPGDLLTNSVFDKISHYYYYRWLWSYFKLLHPIDSTALKNLILYPSAFWLKVVPKLQCRLICLVEFTDTNSDNSHLSCTLFWLSLCWMEYFSNHLVPQLTRAIISWSIRNTSCALKRQEDFWEAVSWSSKFFSCCILAHILGHFHYLHPHFFGKFSHNFRC